MSFRIHKDLKKERRYCLPSSDQRSYQNCAYCKEYFKCGCLWRCCRWCCCGSRRGRCLCCKNQFAYSSLKAVPYLRVIEYRSSKGIFLLQVRELHIILASCIKFSAVFQRPHAVLVNNLAFYVSPVVGWWSYYDTSYFVVGFVCILERLLLSI